MSTTTWRNELSEALTGNGESWDDVEDHTFAGTELDRRFDPGYGGSEGVPFTLWTKRRVYFPVVYDGAEWVGWTPRNPNGEATSHVGGE